MTCRALGHGQDCDANGVEYICKQGDGGPACGCALAPVKAEKGQLVESPGVVCQGTPSAAARCGIDRVLWLVFGFCALVFR